MKSLDDFSNKDVPFWPEFWIGKKGNDFSFLLDQNSALPKISQQLYITVKVSIFGVGNALIQANLKSLERTTK